LPNGYRKIFLLHEVAGYEHREIAKFLGCSVGNSKSQLHKARQRIRQLLTHSTPLRAASSAGEKFEFRPRPARRWDRSKVIAFDRLMPRPPDPVDAGTQRWANAA
jgi:CubicO group peptidase (beta-lactamase class C family)